jgi:hypothetical protein
MSDTKAPVQESIAMNKPLPSLPPMSDIKPRIKESVATNKALLATLTRTDHAAPALEQHKRFLATLKSDLNLSTRNLRSYEERRKKELKEHEDYRDSHFKKFVYRATGKSGKFAERASKEEREYLDVLQKLHTEETVNAEMKARVAEAETVLRELEEELGTNRDAQRRLDELYQSIFSGPTPQFPGDDEREARSDRALQAYHDTRVRVEAETQVMDILNQAATDMRYALSAMEEALSHSRMDMFGGGSFSDMMERDSLNQAERRAQSAQMHVMRAQRISPSGVGNFPNLRFVERSFWGDIVFDNIFSDMEMHERIKDGRVEFQRGAEWVRAQIEAANDRSQVAKMDLRDREAELEAARRDLQKFREDVFEKVANGEGTANMHAK